MEFDNFTGSRKTKFKLIPGDKSAHNIALAYMAGDEYLLSGKPWSLVVIKPHGKYVILSTAKEPMSKDEIKYEINRVLDKFSSDALEELLSFLKQLEERNNPATVNSDVLQKILSEDKELLEKLAQ